MILNKLNIVYTQKISNQFSQIRDKSSRMICIQGQIALMPVKRAPSLIVLFVHTHIMQISLDLSALHIHIISFKLFCFSSFLSKILF